MSDAVIVSIVGAIGTLTGLALTGYVSIKLASIQKQVNKIDVVENKVDDYHKEVNGKMGKLLETTAALATAKEKEKGDAALNVEKLKGK